MNEYYFPMNSYIVTICRKMWLNNQKYSLCILWCFPSFFDALITYNVSRVNSRKVYLFEIRKRMCFRTIFKELQTRTRATVQTIRLKNFVWRLILSSSKHFSWIQCNFRIIASLSNVLFLRMVTQNMRKMITIKNIFIFKE